MRPSHSPFGFSALLAAAAAAAAQAPAKPAEPAAEVREALAKVRVGSTFQEVEVALRPVLLDQGRTWGGGTGRHVRVYHLRGDWQVVLVSGSHPRDETVAEIRKPQPKEPWRGLFWLPSAAEKAAAARTAADALRDEIKAGRDPAARFPTNPAGRLVSEDGLSAELELRPGVKTKFEVSAGEGRWQTHKLITVNFLRGEDWHFQVLVDLNDGKAVPSQWTPAEADIAKARAIADPTLGEFLGKTEKERAEVRVRAWGKYDYGSLRRLLVLSYTKPEGLAEAIKFVTVDLDNGRPAD